MSKAKSKPHRWRSDERCIVCEMHREWVGARHGCTGIAYLAPDVRLERDRERAARRYQPKVSR